MFPFIVEINVCNGSVNNPNLWAVFWAQKCFWKLISFQREFISSPFCKWRVFDKVMADIDYGTTLTHNFSKQKMEQIAHHVINCLDTHSPVGAFRRHWLGIIVCSRHTCFFELVFSQHTPQWLQRLVRHLCLRHMRLYRHWLCLVDSWSLPFVLWRSHLKVPLFTTPWQSTHKLFSRVLIHCNELLLLKQSTCI